MKKDEFLLLLIGSLGGTIEGETRLQKLTFLAKTEYDVHLPFQFKWSNYGPFSDDVEDCKKEMELSGLLKEERIPLESYKMHSFTLTEKGKKEFNRIKQGFWLENEVVNNLIGRFGQKRLHDILSYVYGRYTKNEEGDIIAVNDLF